MKKVKLRTIAQITAGQGAPQGDFAYGTSGIPFIKAGHLKDLVAGTNEYDLPKISEDIATQYQLKIYPAGAIIFAKSGMSCTKGYVYQLQSNCYVVNHLAVIIPNSKEDGNYLRHYFTFCRPNALVKDESYPSISLSDIGNIEIRLYPSHLQNKITKTLNLIEHLTMVRKGQLAKLNRLASSRFIEMFGDPDNNTKNYPTAKIGDIAQCIAGATPSTAINEYWDNGNIPWMSSGEVNLGRVFSTEKKITQKGYDNASTHLVPPHTVVLAMAGQGRTRGTVAITEIELCTNQSLCSLVTTPQTINPFYLFHYLKTQYDNLRNASNGDGGRGGLNLRIIGNYRIILPPLALQNEFAAFIEQLDKSKVTIQKSLDRLNLLYKALLQEYFG